MPTLLACSQEACRVNRWIVLVLVTVVCLGGCRPGQRPEIRAEASENVTPAAETPAESNSSNPTKVDPECHSLAVYKEALKSRGEDLDAQAVLIETVDQRERIAEHN